MRRFAILCVLCALYALAYKCGSVFGTNEIRSFNAGATTCYAVVRDISGQVWYVTGQAWETWGTGGRTAADYDIVLSNKTAGMFVGTMDTNIGAGQYYIVTLQQAGGTPADTDPAVWQEFGDWTGSVWTPATLTSGDIADAVWDEVVADHTGETTFGGEVQQLDPNITILKNYAVEWDPNFTTILNNTTAIKAVTDIMRAVNSTVAVADDANSFTLTAGLAVADAYRGMTIYVKDATDGNWDAQMIAEYTAGRVVTVDAPMAFTPDVGDIVVIWGLTAYPVDVFDGLPMPPEPETTIVDLRAGTAGGGTRTLNEEQDDP